MPTSRESPARLLHVWCPLPPARTGTAVYLAEQLPHLAAQADVVAVLDDEAAAREAAERYGIRTLTADQALQARDGLHIIHLANNPWHAYCFRAALELSAFLVIHDMSLHHLVTEMTLAHRDKGQYLSILTSDAGTAGRRFALQRDNGFYTERMQFYVRCFEPVLGRARGVINHSLWAREYMRSRYGVERGTWIPHHAHIGEAAKAMTRAEARRYFGLREDALLVSIPGYLSPAKDVGTLLRLADDLSRDHETEVFISGDGDVDFLDAEERAILDRLGTRIGYLSDDDFDKVFVASDFVSCLRYPTTGESSGVFAKTLAAGSIPIYLPVLGCFEPQPCGVPVPRTPEGLAEAKGTLRQLAREPDRMSALRDRSGRMGRARNVAATVGKIWSFIDDNASADVPIMEG